jgi:hypothetical protein
LSSSVIDYLGESNLVLADNDIIELRDDIFVTNFQPYGIMQLEADIPIFMSSDSYVVEGGQMIINDLELAYKIANGYGALCFTKELPAGSSTRFDLTEWNHKLYPKNYQTYLYIINIDSPTVNIGDTISSGYTALLSEGNLNSALNWLSASQFNSGVTHASAPSLILTLNGTVPNDLMKGYKCYLVKTNLVSIKCSNAINNQQFISVTSCNNL